MRFFSVLGQMAVERLRQRGLLGHEHAAGEKDARRSRELDVLEEPVCESGRRYRSLVQNTSDIITLIDADGTVHYESSALEQVMGYKPEDQIGTKAFDWVHPDDVEQALSIFAQVLSTPGLHAPIEFRAPHKDGSWRYLEHTINNLLDDPDVRGIVVTSRDITERREFEEQLKHQAFHDSLTDLPNRALFMDRLEHALARMSRSERCVAVLFLDLNNFKLVNDSLGHEVGDQLLIAVAERLKACSHPGDTVARLGGDEFAILLEDIRGKNEATDAAERVAEELRSSFMLGEYEVHTTASVGIALSSSNGDQAENLLRSADMAMYQAKNKGRVYSLAADAKSMPKLALKRLELESDLRRAIKHEEFRVCYQPEVLLEHGRIVAVEALVRWEHPERGLLLPGKFIPVAEETGLIVPIGQWVLETACQQARAWQQRYPADPPLVMCVNLSPRHFRHPSLVDEIVEILQKTGLEPSSLGLEITESVVMEDARSTVATLRELAALGVQLAIDDFGTGYSSLSYLKHFPVSFLKIDRSFIDGLEEGSKDGAILEAVIGLAQALGMKAIAEGVESAEQLAQLREMGCEMGQGYYFTRPLPSEAASELLATHSPA